MKDLFTAEKDVYLTEGVNQLGNGWSADIYTIEPYAGINPDDTDDHESAHVVAAIENGTNVKMATSIAGDGYDGMTVTERPDPVAAAAAGALGHKGAGYDMWLIGRMGHNPAEKRTEARNLLSGKGRELHAVASELHMLGTITGGIALRAIDRVRNPNIKIIFTNPIKEKHQFVTRVRRASGYIIPIIIFEQPKKDVKNKEKSTEDKTVDNNTKLEDTLIRLHPLVNKIHGFSLN